jgi:hypothetical protein
MPQRRITKLGATYFSVVALFTLFDPTKLPTVALIVPFLLLFFAFYFTVSEITQYQLSSVGSTQYRMRVALMAGFPTLLLLLQSIGQLSGWEFLLVGAVFCGMYFYLVNLPVLPSRN